VAGPEIVEHQHLESERAQRVERLHGEARVADHGLLGELDREPVGRQPRTVEKFGHGVRKTGVEQAGAGDVH
jgi:hypothetical protein